jgi:hypothetical protein
MWNVTNYVDTVPPVADIEPMGLWELGNWVISGAAVDVLEFADQDLDADDTHRYMVGKQWGCGSWATGSSQVRFEEGIAQIGIR